MHENEIDKLRHDMLEEQMKLKNAFNTHDKELHTKVGIGRIGRHHHYTIVV